MIDVMLSGGEMGDQLVTVDDWPVGTDRTFTDPEGDTLVYRRNGDVDGVHMANLVLEIDATP